MSESKSPDVVIIGSGPAGLAAAEVVAGAGKTVWIVDQKPSFGRKFLMAGKSGLNLTKAVSTDDLIEAIDPPAPQIDAALRAFDGDAVVDWTEGHGIPVFEGSSGRVFPNVMKASPLLRAILAKLSAKDVRFLPRWRWMGGHSEGLRFDTPEGPVSLTPRATILALGGASWARLGSDGAWASHFDIAPFQPANVGARVVFSEHMAKFAGHPVKNVRLTVGQGSWRGEFVIKPDGLEGGGIYAASAALRKALVVGPAALFLDLYPDRTIAALNEALQKPMGKLSTSNYLRKVLGLDGARAALVHEAFCGKIPVSERLAAALKSLPLQIEGLRPLDEAISTAGGLPLSQLDADLMLKAHPGTFAAGEMLDWEAPTGGYLITTCLATGRLAGLGALRWLDQVSAGDTKAVGWEG